ncbi:hypothetical protein chiPu_0006612 [Chiloscyllium punctatum]|uniref:Adhesion G-protein coupled receptor F3 Ig-like domain-containing protein n=1 Tax=Chiloscyllium punctatum TaxID=137246 RepID=A0A401SCW0_CHIPU|nr:hypothetical protein [Chiloscyllium punctatum]
MMITVYPETIYYRKPLRINCTINDKVESVNWFIKGPKDKEKAIISSRHYNFVNDPISTSNLEINATSMWKGRYYCYFYFANGSMIHEATGDSNIVLLPEEITTIPSQYSIERNETIPVKCCIKDDGENYTVTLEARGSSENEASCKNENSDGYSWQTTTAGQYAESKDTCAEGSVGKIVRFCKEDGEWDKVFLNCTDKALIKLLTLAQVIFNVGFDEIYLPNYEKIS